MAKAAAASGRKVPSAAKKKIRRAVKAPVATAASPAPVSGKAALEQSTTARPAAKIFQIYFEPFQRDLIDPAFIPLDNQGPPSRFLEFDIFNRLYLSDHVKDVPLWGALSWRFTEKTGLTGRDLLDVIDANPGRDVYFCNPFPKHEALFHNLWLQGETAHPRFLELSRAFLSAAELPPQETEIIWPSSLYSSANYFVGTPAFWESYLRFVGGAIRRADQALPDEIKKQLYSNEADDRNIHGGTSYMPFIVERLFPLFLRSAGRELKAFKVPLPLPEQELDVHLRLLRQMKDEAHGSKSAWLAACWANYRSLYFAQKFGQDWTRKYLRAVTPTSFKFA